MTYHPGTLTTSQVEAKGDLLVATGPTSVTRLPAGSDASVLTAKATEPAGLGWQIPASPPTGGGLDSFLLMGA